MPDLLVRLALWQVGVPLVLMAVHALVPSASRTGLILRIAAILLVLCYTALAGLWLFPPWWTPYLLIALHLLTSLRLWRRYRDPGAGRPRRFAEVGVAAALLTAAGLMILPVHRGRTSPDVAIDLAQPLGPGRYLVISGGADKAINAHFETLDGEGASDFRGQSHAVDIIGIDALGLRAAGISPSNPSAYLIYGREVRAPCAGRVTSAVDGIADNAVPAMNRDSMTGNSLILDCAGRAVVMAHFAPGSLAVRGGDRVETGQRVARVGNSGNSGEPHLHVHVQTLAGPDAPISGEPLWFTIDGELPVRNSRFTVGE